MGVTISTYSISTKNIGHSIIKEGRGEASRENRRHFIRLNALINDTVADN